MDHAVKSLRPVREIDGNRVGALALHPGRSLKQVGTLSVRLLHFNCSRGDETPELPGRPGMPDDASAPGGGAPGGPPSPPLLGATTVIAESVAESYVSCVFM
jgi:hypothetical protein